MGGRESLVALGLIALSLGGSPIRPEETPERPAATSDVPEADGERLDMTPAVVCEAIRGYREYQARPEPALTRDEKLLIYYEPQNHTYEEDGGHYRAHLTQDVRIRRKGQKKALWKQDRMFEYRPEAKFPPVNICMQNAIAIKPLRPGKYELEIILHDELSDGPPARQVVPFRVIPAPTAREKAGEASGNGSAPTDPPTEADPFNSGPTQDQGSDAEQP